MTFCDDIDIAGDGEEIVPQRCGFVHRHDLEAIHDRFNSFDGVYFRDDDMGTQSLGTHGNALAAPAIAGDDHGLAGDREVCAADDTVPCGLAGAVAVIEEVLAVGIVDRNHREFQLFILFQDLQAVYAGGCFFGAADEVLPCIHSRGMEQVYQVAAVVDDDVRHMVQGFIQEHGVFLVRATVPCIDGDAVLYEGCGNGILGGQWVAAGADDVGPCCFQGQCQVRGLGFQMDGHDDGLALEGLVFDEFLPQRIEGGHEFCHPPDALFTVFSQGNIPNHRITHNCKLLSYFFIAAS